MQVWNLLHAARWKYSRHKWRKKSPSAHRHTNLSACIFSTKACIDNRKKVVKQQYLPTCPHNMANFGSLMTEIGSGIWGRHPANFNGFRVLAALLQRRRSPEANQTLHDVWPSPGLVHYIHRVSKKNVLPLACYILDTCEQILIFFGRNVTDKVHNQKTLYYPTSNNLCFCTTW